MINPNCVEAEIVEPYPATQQWFRCLADIRARVDRPGHLDYCFAEGFCLWFCILKLCVCSRPSLYPARLGYSCCHGCSESRSFSYPSVRPTPISASPNWIITKSFLTSSFSNHSGRALIPPSTFRCCLSIHSLLLLSSSLYFSKHNRSKASQMPFATTEIYLARRAPPRRSGPCGRRGVVPKQLTAM